MQFGICANVDQSPAVKAAGWDFVEGAIQKLLQGAVPDDQWTGPQLLAQSPLPVPSACMLVPGSLKITGPDTNPDKLRAYMQTTLSRAPKLGLRTLVFGSGGARNIPDGFDRDQARQQILDFVAMSAQIAAHYNVTLVAEPLNKKESNVLNSVAEAMTYVKAINHPNFQCLVDTYHFWAEDEPLENLKQAMPWIKHVHLADKEGRVAPGLSGTSDYRPFFRVLKDGSYNGLLSVEAPKFDIAKDGNRVLEFLKKQWNEA